MSLIEIFACADCEYVKFQHPPGIFHVNDLFYCWKCTNYTDNVSELVTCDDPESVMDLEITQSTRDKSGE